MDHVAADAELAALADEYHPLALREAQEAELTPEEQERLAELRTALESALPHPEGLPEDVVAAVAEVRQVLGVAEEWRGADGGRCPGPRQGVAGASSCEQDVATQGVAR